MVARGRGEPDAFVLNNYRSRAPPKPRERLPRDGAKRQLLRCRARRLSSPAAGNAPALCIKGIKQSDRPEIIVAGRFFFTVSERRVFSG